MMASNEPYVIEIFNLSRQEYMKTSGASKTVVEHMKTSELANQNSMQIHAVGYTTGTPNDGFLLNTLTAL